MVSARDAWGLRPLVQPVLDRVQKSQFGKRLVGVDLDAVVAAGRAFVDAEPRTFKALGDHLLERWPGRDRFALEQTIRTAVPLIQVPPRGLWGRSGPIAHTSIEAWLGAPPRGAGRPRRAGDALPGCLRAGQRHGRPGVVRADPAGATCSSACGRASSPSATSPGASCSTCPTRHGRTRTSRRRRASCTTSTTCCCRTRTGRGVLSAEAADAVRPRDPGAGQHVHARRVRRRDVAHRARAASRSGHAHAPADPAVVEA